MRFVFLSAWLTLALFACDHRPKKQQPAAAPPTETAVPGGEAGCLTLGTKIAEVIITATTDATQRAAYEQERGKLVQRFSENCTREQWSDATRACFHAAKTAIELDACSRELAKANAAAAPPAAAAGSAGSAKPSTLD